MRCRNQNSRVVLGQRPFAGDLGASLYVGKDDPANIVYRRPKVSCDRSPWWPVSTTVIDPGAASIPKTQAVAQVTSPTKEFNFALPAALVGEDVWYQVRTFESDYENETIYGPRNASTDGSGNDSTAVVGTARIILLQKRDGGVMRIGWTWTPSPNGVQPTQFVITKTAGSGTVPNVVVPVTSSRSYQVDVPGLSNGVSYTFSLEAENLSVTTILVSGIAFVGDSAGPPEVSGLVIVES